MIVYIPVARGLFRVPSVAKDIGETPRGAKDNGRALEFRRFDITLMADINGNDDCARRIVAELIQGAEGVVLVGSNDCIHNAKGLRVMADG